MSIASFIVATALSFDSLFAIFMVLILLFKRKEITIRYYVTALIASLINITAILANTVFS